VTFATKIGIGWRPPPPQPGRSAAADGRRTQRTDAAPRLFRLQPSDRRQAARRPQHACRAECLRAVTGADACLRQLELAVPPGPQSKGSDCQAASMLPLDASADLNSSSRVEPRRRPAVSSSQVLDQWSEASDFIVQGHMCRLSSGDTPEITWRCHEMSPGEADRVGGRPDSGERAIDLSSRTTCMNFHQSVSDPQRIHR
jgi:hypothetical protein